VCQHVCVGGCVCVCGWPKIVTVTIRGLHIPRETDARSKMV
jgi:hypothetical protein